MTAFEWFVLLMSPFTALGVLMCCIFLHAIWLSFSDERRWKGKR